MSQQGCQLATRVCRTEAGCVAGIVGLAVVVRLLVPERLGVEHFDEGVYASNIFFTAENHYQYPLQYLYAPPFVPRLIEWLFVFFGPSNAGACLPNIAAGSLTVAAVWWIGRSWFGPVAGLVSALLAATSDVHLLFSRSALTDVWLCLWLLLAVFFFERGMKRYLLWTDITPPGPRLVRGESNTLPLTKREAEGGRTASDLHPLVFAALSGLCAGLAWWTKYTGWLSLAITGAGGLAWAITATDRRLGLKVFATCWGAMLLVTLLVWCPFWWSLQEFGGYGVIAANHRGYVTGWSQWWPHLLVQWRHLESLEGRLTLVGMTLFIATLLGQMMSHPPALRFTCNARSSRLMWLGSSTAILLGAIGLATLVSGVFGQLLLGLIGLGAASLGGLFRRKNVILAKTIGEELQEARQHPSLPQVEDVSSRSDCTSLVERRSSLAAWLLLAWWCGLVLAIPLYVPYLRLTLPLVCCGWLACGAAVRSLPRLLSAGGDPAETPHQHVRQSPRGLVATLVLVAGLTALGGLMSHGSTLLQRGVPGWENRAHLEEVARRILDSAYNDQVEAGRDEARRDEFLIQVYGEPSLYFQLKLLGAKYVVPTARVDNGERSATASAIPQYLVIGPHAAASSDFEREWTHSKSFYRHLVTIPRPPSLLVWLDQPASRPPGSERGRRMTFDYQLYILSPTPKPPG